MLYSKISAETGQKDPIKSMKRLMSEVSGTKGKFTVKISPIM